MAARFIVLSVLLPTLVFGFTVDRGTILNHQEITKRAVLNVLVLVCQDKAKDEGWTFRAPAEAYTIENVLEACQIQVPIESVYRCIDLIIQSNIKVDQSSLYTSPPHHFHNEAFEDGRDIVATGLAAVKASIMKGNDQAAKILLGKILHTLQDFYSNSNWIELANVAPNTNLLKGDTKVGNIAAINMTTCQSCSEKPCNNILDIIKDQNILTSGYLAILPSKNKPEGKCSNGGPLDGSSSVDPKGGINKDTPDSPHGHYHEKAANVAIAATTELLEDVRDAGGDTAFLQMIGASTGKALCFVIDTTGSMTSEIVALQQIASRLVDESGQQQSPAMYMLVQFKDPSYGPVFMTTDPYEFKKNIDSLSATGGGDGAEMSLSALQLAVMKAPPGSVIFVVTDDAAKDANLVSSLIPGIELNKLVVNFLLNGILEKSSDSDPYDKLANASVGLLIRTTASQLALADDFVLDSYSSSLTLLAIVRNHGKSGKYSFTVDSDLYDPIVYITGSISEVTFVNPSGLSPLLPQDFKPVLFILEKGAGGNSERSETVATSQSVGNFQRFKLIKKVGIWEIHIESNNPYTVKVFGESQLTFIYNLLEPAQGPLGGLTAHYSRPRAGNNSMVLTLIGSETATLTEVYLVELTGAGQVKGTITHLRDKEFLAKFENVPAKEYYLLVKGTNTVLGTQMDFQRLSSGIIKMSSLSVITAEVNGILEPGVTTVVPFSVLSGNNGIYNITATYEQGFLVTAPDTLNVADGIADGKATITAPDGAESGTQVTLVIQAAAPGQKDMNYAIVHFIVLKKVTDFSGPECEVVSKSSCPQICGSSRWQLTAQVSDDTGVFRVHVRPGNGTMTLRVASGNPRMVTYEAPCCSTQAEMVVVDNEGNVNTCTFSTRVANDTATTATTASSTASQNVSEQTTVSMSPKLMQSSLLCLILSLIVIHCN